MRMTAFAITLVLTLFTASAQAVESEFQITPRFGRGELRIDEFRGREGDIGELETFGLGVTFGFLTPVGLVLAGGFESYGNLTFFNATDQFTIEQEFLALGYQFELGDGWRLVPQVGRGRWELTSEEGQLFHPGPEETDRLHRYENFWELTFARRVNRVMALGVSARGAEFDFGRSRSIAFVMAFGF